MSSNLEQHGTPEEGRVQPAQQSTVSPGRELARRREELNLTVEQVAGQLNLAPRQIEAIEADNFDALPGMVIARGFVRSYAKLVKLDADPLLAAMAPAVAAIPDEPLTKQAYVVNKPLSGARLTFGQKNGRKSKMMWIALALVLIVIAAFVTLQPTGPASISSLMPSDASQTTTEKQASAPDGRAVEVLPVPEVSPEAEPGNAPPADMPAPAPQSALSSDVGPVKADLPAEGMSAEKVRGNELTLKMREESWVELKRSDGAIIAARLMEAGTEESFRIKGEMNLVVGNASGVDATLRGEPLDLQAKARANVARLKLK